MAKTYIDIVKYMIYAKVEIDGLVEKPDVVGAIFGQTEGLIGEDLDLRELQKSGRIGRIDVDLDAKGGRTTGKIIVPSSLDMVETSILASALETVERVGPCEAKVAVEKIEDTRNAKRKYIVDRAKQLLKTVLNDEIPESKVISEMVRDEVKIAEISEYGPDKLPSGPNLDKYDSIIIVEGRADVLNMLKNDISNVIAVGGARINETVVNLSKQKETTIFIDGDRGGDIILRSLSENGEIDFVARAPTGKEVEDLSRKEIIKCIRNKIPFEQFVAKRGYKWAPHNSEEHDDNEQKNNLQQQNDNKNNRRNEQQTYQHQNEQTTDNAQKAQYHAPQDEDAKKQLSIFLPQLDELENTLRARIFATKDEPCTEVPVRDIIKKLEEMQKGYAIVFDGVITQRLLELADEKGFKYIVGIRKGHVYRDYPNLHMHIKYT